MTVENSDIFPYSGESRRDRTGAAHEFKADAENWLGVVLHTIREDLDALGPPENLRGKELWAIKPRYDEIKKRGDFALRAKQGIDAGDPAIINLLATLDIAAQVTEDPQETIRAQAEDVYRVLGMLGVEGVE